MEYIYICCFEPKEVRFRALVELINLSRQFLQFLDMLLATYLET